MIEASEHRVERSDESSPRPLWAEHQALAASAERVELALRTLSVGGAGPATGPLAQDLVDEFRRRLLHHFDLEERGRLLEGVAVAEPRFERRVAKLRSEHTELRLRVAELEAEVVDGGWTVVHARFLAFRRDLAVHEQAENELLQRAHLEDIGGRG